MEHPQQLWLIVPCHNEAERLDARAFTQFARQHPQFGFLFVDDASTDGTADVVRTIKDGTLGAVQQLTLEQNRGKAEAVRQGVLHLREGGAAWIGYLDADLATPLSALVDFERYLVEYPETQMILGSRVQLLGKRIERHPARHYFGRVAGTVVSMILGLQVYDTQCGAKLFRVSPALMSVFAEPFETNWTFGVEILARWLIETRPEPAEVHSQLVELPLKNWTDVPGSKLTWRDFLRAPFDLIRIQRRYGSELRSWKDEHRQA